MRIKEKRRHAHAVAYVASLHYYLQRAETSSMQLHPASKTLESSVETCQAKAASAQAIDIPASKGTISGHSVGIQITEQQCFKAHLWRIPIARPGGQAGALRMWGAAAFSYAGANPACCYCDLRWLWGAQKVCS